MPTVGWILEGATERFLEGRPLPASAPASVFVCPTCGARFTGSDEVSRHLSLLHPLDLPSLYIRGRPIAREAIIRTPVREREIDLVQCSRCEVQVDGGEWRPMSPSAFSAQITATKYSTWNVRLFNERPVDGSRAQDQYHIRFRIPEAAMLTAIDEHFVRTLVQDELKHSHLAEFEATLPASPPEREYGGALGDYAVGVLLKEQRVPPRSAVGYQEFAVKMRGALEILVQLHRPVALVVVGSIRFNLNDFHDHGVPTGPELQPGFQFFRRLTGVIDSSLSNASVARGLSKAVCPIDKVSYQLLAACTTLVSHGTMAPGEIEAIRQLTRGGGTLMSEQDLVKAHALCAEAYRRIGKSVEASYHLRAIQFDPSLSSWAQSQLN